MESLRIDIINPKAKKILEELADLKLISIRSQQPMKSFEKLLKKLRSSKPTITIDEITQEVESVRSKRYAKNS